MRGRRRRRKEGGSTCLIIMKLFWAALSFRWSQTLVFLYVCDTVGWSSLTRRHTEIISTVWSTSSASSLFLFELLDHRSGRWNRPEEKKKNMTPPSQQRWSAFCSLWVVSDSKTQQSRWDVCCLQARMGHRRPCRIIKCVCSTNSWTDSAAVVEISPRFTFGASFNVLQMQYFRLCRLLDGIKC